MDKATFNALMALDVQTLVLETERPRLLEHNEDELLLGVHESLARVTGAKAPAKRRQAARETR